MDNIDRQKHEHDLDYRSAALLIAIALLIFVPGIGVTLFDRDEGWYAQVSREMLQTKDWLIPRYLGEVWLAKPPLLYWLVASSFKIFGIGEWQARLVPAGASILNVLLVAALTAGIYNRRTGLIAGLIFAVTNLHVVVGRMLLTDSLMLSCTLLAVLIHWRLATRGATTALYAGYWLAIGLGLLAKGPAILLFAGAFALGLAATGFWQWRSGRFWRWSFIAALIAGPWYTSIAWHTPQTFLGQFFGFEILSRIAGAPHGHTGPPGYYLLLALSGLLPWTILVAGALISTFQRRPLARDVRLLLFWLLPWIVLEFIRSKLPHYILPCYVPLTILLARGISQDPDWYGYWSDLPKPKQLVLLAWTRLMIAVGVILILFVGWKWKPTWFDGVLASGIVLIAGFALTEWVVRRKSIPAGGAAAIATMTACYMVASLYLLPLLETSRLSRTLAEAINDSTPAGERVILCGYDEPTVYFYLEKPARPVDPEKLGKILSSPDAFTLAITPSAWDAARSLGLPRITREVSSRELQGFNYSKMSRETVYLLRIPKLLPTSLQCRSR